MSSFVRVLSESRPNVARVLSWCYKILVRILQESCPDVTRTLSECCKNNHSDYIKKLHHILKQSTSDTTSSVAVVGDFKKYPNVIGTVGEIQTTPPEKVKSEMDALNNNYENTQEKVTLETITDYHVTFEKIHPFQMEMGE